MKKPIPALIPVLIFISALFIGILVFAYVETKHANPQMIQVGAALWGRRFRLPSRATARPGPSNTLENHSPKTLPPDVAQALMPAAPRLFGALGGVRTSPRFSLLDPASLGRTTHRA